MADEMNREVMVANLVHSSYTLLFEPDKCTTLTNYIVQITCFIFVYVIL